MVIRLVFLSISTIWTVKYCQKRGFFKFLFLFCQFVFVTLIIIALHNGVYKHSLEKNVICDVVSEQRIPVVVLTNWTWIFIPISWMFSRCVWKNPVFQLFGKPDLWSVHYKNCQELCNYKLPLYYFPLRDLAQKMTLSNRWSTMYLLKQSYYFLRDVRSCLYSSIISKQQNLNLHTY